MDSRTDNGLARKFLLQKQHPLSARLRPSLPKAFRGMAKPLALPTRLLLGQHSAQPRQTRPPIAHSPDLSILRPNLPIASSTSKAPHHRMSGQAHPLPILSPPSPPRG